ncbi:HD-GYP domain-containing protein [Desulfosporosinus sp. PR]|uniref:HD-GYP domain-containing protein n=1 Tax=Candidatus Desulfosporosinus nitrosoreducens TaxID=3401928 RepID=UPI0027F9C343|nr:HD-GYP domain-containing protein [Desulfosporosinus sp. PR]MDQ7092360.1 HD-GYP domain-containing protein [Desulfosporosinus sp. PR]
MNLVLEKLPPCVLAIGEQIKIDLFDASGILLLTRGQLMTEWIWRKLAKKEIYTLKSDKNFGKSALSDKDCFSEDLYCHIVGSIWNIYHEVRLVTTEQISQTVTIVEQIINEIRDKYVCIDFDTPRIDMLRLKEYDYSTFVHAVNVAILSALIARKLGYKGRRLRYLTMGALLHDIGKIKVPREILNKPGPLNEDEMNIVKRHPLEGEAMLREAAVAPCILSSVRQHHERWDGRGYPDGLKGLNICQGAQIIAVADVYDALTADRPYRKALPPYHALEMILSADQDFNPQVVEAFRKSLNLYPRNTVVTLNTGEVGLVVAVPTSLPTRPLVKLIFDRDGKYIDEEKYIDLMKELTYFIQCVEKKESYTDYFIK